MAYQRKLDNWLLGFQKWSVPTTEAPETYLMWSGLFTLSAAVRKHVKIPKAYLGSWESFPNLYIVLVGPPAVKKTTALAFTDDLLSKLPEVPASPTKISEAALASALSTSIDGSIYITASELASLVGKSKLDMYEFLTDGFDSRKDIKVMTISRGLEVIPNPCINMMACTQPAWILENMPASVIGGGFASRCIFVFEGSTSRWQMYYRNIDQKEMEKLGADLLSDLIHISQLQGEFSVTTEALDFMEDWYQNGMRILQTRDPRLQGYFARRHVHAHKVAQLISLAKKDELSLGIEEFKQAIAILEISERSLMNVFRNIGRNSLSADTDAIRDFVKANKKVERGEILKNFQASALPDVIDKLVNGLIAMGDLTQVYEEGRYYVIPKDKS